MKMPRFSAADIAHILKEIGKGNMGCGVGVIAIIGMIIGAIAVAIAAVLASKAIRDPELIQLEERLKANELYEIARRGTEQKNAEIEELNRKIGEVLASGKKDQEQLESLKARLLILILQLQLAGIGKIAAGSDTATALDAVIANGLVPDPDLRHLAERLRVANESYGTGKAAEQQKAEITDLNERVGGMLRSLAKDKEQLESLNARLVALIEQLEKAPIQFNQSCLTDRPAA